MENTHCAQVMGNLHFKYINSQHLLVLSLRTTYPATNQLTAVTVARTPMCRKGAVDW